MAARRGFRCGASGARVRRTSREAFAAPVPRNAARSTACQPPARFGKPRCQRFQRLRENSSRAVAPCAGAARSSCSQRLPRAAAPVDPARRRSRRDPIRHHLRVAQGRPGRLQLALQALRRCRQSGCGSSEAKPSARERQRRKATRRSCTGVGSEMLAGELAVRAGPVRSWRCKERRWQIGMSAAGRAASGDSRLFLRDYRLGVLGFRASRAPSGGRAGAAAPSKQRRSLRGDRSARPRARQERARCPRATARKCAWGPAGRRSPRNEIPRPACRTARAARV